LKKDDDDQSNIGQVGVDSIRIAATKIEDLPMVAGAHAKTGIAAAIQNEKQNRINTIRAKYPAHHINQLEGWVKECEENVQRVQIFKGQQSDMINQYTGHISMCEYRDKELARLDPDNPGELEQIKALKKQFPPYNVEKMREQIQMCREGLERGDLVIAKEYESLAMLREQIALCQHRDMELRAAGADVG